MIINCKHRKGKDQFSIGSQELTVNCKYNINIDISIHLL